jgi:hypothetical protein
VGNRKLLILRKNFTALLGTTQAEHPIKSMVRRDTHENIGKGGTLFSVHGSHFVPTVIVLAVSPPAELPSCGSRTLV